MSERATITLRGVDDGASDILREVGAASESMADSVEEATRRSSDAANRMRGALITAAAGMTALNQGAQLVGRAFRAVSGSMEQLIRSTEEGRESWARLEEQQRAVRGGLGALVIGTTDAVEAARRWGEMLQVTQDLIASVTAVIGPLVNAIRVALVGGLGILVRALERLSGGAAQARRELALLETQARATADAEQARAGAIDAETTRILGDTQILQQRRLQEQIEGVADAYAEMAVQQMIAADTTGGSIERIAGDLQTHLRDAIVAGDDLNTVLLQIGSGPIGTRQITIADALDAVMLSAGTAGDAVRELQAGYDEVTGRGSVVVDTIDGITGSLSSGTEALSGYADALGAMSHALDEVALGQAHVRAGSGAQAEATTKLRAQLDAMLASIQPLPDALSAFAADGTTALATLDAAMARSQARAQTMAEITTSAYHGMTDGITQALTGVATGSMTAAQAMNAAVGTALDAVATAAIAQAAIVAVSPFMGGPPVAAAMLAAGIAGKVLAGVLGGRDHGSSNAGGSASAGIAAPRQISNTNVSNTTFVNNFGGLQDRRAVASGMGDAMRDARRMGYA